MQLSRLTPCQVFEIRSPRWNGAAHRREVGLNAKLVQKHNCIRFTYVRKSDGQQSIPGDWYFDGDKLKAVDAEYEYQSVHGTTLVIVPFDEIETLGRS